MMGVITLNKRKYKETRKMMYNVAWRNLYSAIDNYDCTPYWVVNKEYPCVVVVPKEHWSDYMVEMNKFNKDLNKINKMMVTGR